MQYNKSLLISFPQNRRTFQPLVKISHSTPTFLPPLGRLTLPGSKKHPFPTMVYPFKAKISVFKAKISVFNAVVYSFIAEVDPPIAIVDPPRENFSYKNPLTYDLIYTERTQVC
jgi:hypothetical protein